MEIIWGLYREHIGIMENKMETTIVYCAFTAWGAFKAYKSKDFYDNLKFRV